MISTRDNTTESNEIKSRFCDAIRKRPEVIQALKAELDTYPYVCLDKSNLHKTDAVIQLAGPEIRIDIHSFDSGGYNQIDRRSLPKFCDRCGISEGDCEFLRKLVFRKADAPTGLLVFQNEHDRVREIFTGIDVATPALLGDDDPQFMAIFSREKEKYHIYSMIRQVLPALRRGGINFTEKGGNIQVGEYLILQRKGREDGKQTGSANDIQTKMYVKRFFENEPLCELDP